MGKNYYKKLCKLNEDFLKDYFEKIDKELLKFYIGKKVYKNGIVCKLDNIKIFKGKKIK